MLKPPLCGLWGGSRGRADFAGTPGVRIAGLGNRGRYIEDVTGQNAHHEND